MFRVVLSVLIAALLSGTASATSYISVTFEELVTRADVIFAGEVIDVRPFPLRTRDGLVIKTRVVFRVADPLFGTTAALEVFDFLGGEWGELEMAVDGMPTFAIGDRRVVFARRERSINPIVGFTQGLLRIERDNAGVERVFTLNGLPLERTEHIGILRMPTMSITMPMRLADFRDRITRRLTQIRRR